MPDYPMTACNDCWDEAFRRSQIGGGHQVEHYGAILLLPSRERPWCAFTQSMTRAAPEEPAEFGGGGYYAYDLPTLERAADHNCLDEDVNTGDPLVCRECAFPPEVSP